VPVISIDQFIAIADRIAAIYDLFLKVDQQVNSSPPDGYYQDGASYPARLQVDLTGTGTNVVLTAKISGESSNLFSFMMINPGVPSSPLASISVSTNLGLSLQTDANKNIVSTPEDIISLIENDMDFSEITVTYPVGNVGGLVIPFPRTSFKGGVGTSTTQAPPIYTIMTLRGGTFGNKYTLTIIQPTTPNAQLDADLNGPDLVISLATDSSGSPDTTVSEMATALSAMQGSSDIFQYSTVANFVVLSQNPDEIVSATEPPDTPVPFSGGGNGVVTEILLTPPPGSTSGTADPDVVQMVPAAQMLDTGITALSIYAGVNVIDQFMAALANHFIRVGQAGGIQGFMTANSILVHKNFSTINTNRTQAPFLASSVFRPDVILLATLKMTGGGITFVGGTPLGTGSGTQSETNFGPQQLVAILEPVSGTLAVDVTFNLSLLGDDGLPKTSDSITFKAGTPSGSIVVITAPTSTNRFYAVSAATWISGGLNGDQVIINQIVERQITL
jgi:hypothetical protein